MSTKPMGSTNAVSYIDSKFFACCDKLFLAGIVLMFYMGVWGHWYANGGPFPPIYGVYLVVLYAIVRLVMQPILFKKITRLGLFWWLLCFLLMLTSNYVLVSIGLKEKYGSYLQDIFNQNLTSISLLFSFLVLLVQKENFLFAIRCVVLGVVCGAVVNFFDIIDFTERWNGPALRAAGFYMNPNGSGTNLSFGLAATIFLIPKQYRLPYFAIYAAGVILTLSRGALPIVALTAAMLLIAKAVNWKALMLLFIAVISIGILAKTVIGNSPKYDLVLRKIAYNKGIQNRINTIFNPGQTKFEVGVRDDVALDHLKFYLQSPIFGNGLSSSMYAQKHITSTNHSSHIQFIHMLNEYGLLGLLLVFALPFSICIYNGRVTFNKMLFLFAVIYIIGCMASHNMYDSRSQLFSYALFGTIVMHTQKLNFRINEV